MKNWKLITVCVVLGLMSLELSAQDASSWEEVLLPPSYNPPLTITWVNGKFITDNGLISADGKKWLPCDTCIDRSKNISWNGNYYFATGYTRTVHRSTDLETWDIVLDNSSEKYLGMAWKDETGVVVGDDGVIWTSTDNGQNWSDQSLPGVTGNLHAVTWAKGRFLAVGNSGVLLQSQDGLNWSLQNTDASIDFYFVLSFKENTYAIGQQTHIWVWNESTVNWSEVIQFSSNRIQGVASNGSHMVLLGSFGSVLRSKDAVSWRQEFLGVQPLSGRAITWHGSQWIVSLEKNGVPVLLRSVAPNSKNWTSQTLANTNTLYDVEWDGRKFLAVGYSWIYSSVDGVNWIPSLNIGSFRTAKAIAHNPQRTVVVGGQGTSGFTTYSEDGVSWSTPTMHTNRLNGVVWTGTYFFAAGNSGLVIRSADGIIWTTIASPGAETLNDIAFAMHITDPASSVIVAIGDNGFIAHADSEGVGWSTKTSGTTERLLAIDILHSNGIYSNGYRTIVGEGGTVISGHWTSYWSSTWSDPTDLVDIVYYDDQVVMLDADGRFIEVDSFSSGQFTVTDTGFSGGSKALTTDGAQWFSCGSQGKIARSHTPFVDRWAEQRRLMSYPENPGTIITDVAAGPESTIYCGDQQLWSETATDHLKPVDSEGLDHVIWDGTQFVGLSSEQQPLRFLTSPDGLTWTYKSDVDSAVYDSHEIAFNGTAYVVHVSWGPSAHRFLRSTDMLNWSLVHAADNLEGPFWVEDQFIAGAGPGVVLTSTDGQSWASQNHNVSTDTLTHVQFLNGTYFATMIGPLSWNVSLYQSSDLINWTEVVDTEATLKEGNGRQILASLNGEDGIYSSTDGQDWSVHNASGSWAELDWNGSTYYGIQSFKYLHNGSAFVSGIVTYKPKAGIGTAWNKSSSPSTSTLRGLEWNGSVWTAVGSNGTILSSPDGLLWQGHNIGESRVFYDIAWNGALLAAVGQSGMIYTSPNGKDWTSRVNATTGWMYGITWDGSQFIAVGGTHGLFVTSPDGITWTLRTDSNAARMRAMATNSSRTVAVGDSGTIMWSNDGIIWSQATTNTSNRLWGVCWRGDSFVAVGENGTILDSTDGISWQTQFYYKNHSFTSVATDGARCIIGTSTGQVIIGTNTGSGKGIWTESQTELTGNINAIAFCGEQWLAAGSGGAIQTSNYGGAFEFWTVNTGRPGYVQGLDPVIVLANATAGKSNMEYHWRDDISGQVFIAETENYIVFDDLTATMELHVQSREVGDISWLWKATSFILVSENPLYFDYNSDQCNDLMDLHQVIQDQWNQNITSDPNADGRVDVRDLLYINTYGGCQ